MIVGVVAHLQPTSQFFFYGRALQIRRYSSETQSFPGGLYYFPSFSEPSTILFSSHIPVVYIAALTVGNGE